MAHWKSMMHRDFIFAFDLNGRDVNVRIKQVKAGELTGEGGRKTKKPIAFFYDKEKGLALNATNCKAIASMYGNDTDKWIGKWITLYPTTTEMGGQTVDCIRVRPQPPRRSAQQQPVSPTSLDPTEQPGPIDEGDPEPPEDVPLSVEYEPGAFG